MIHTILQKIGELSAEKSFLLVAIDGRCCAGKTSLSKKIRANVPCNIIHMDDFFLRPEQRTEKRLKTPGENIDHERFLPEVLLPLSQNKEFSFRPYDCKQQTLAGAITVPAMPLTIIEGSYSCHESLRQYYDLRIFLDTDEDLQLQRIKNRNGANALDMFRNKWIPLEEAYFKAFSVRNQCELYFKT